MTIAMVFQGQGSQSVGMLGDFIGSETAVDETFAEASQVLGMDMTELVLNGPTEILNQTANTQPALLASSVALWRLWQARGGAAPTLLAGHSLGEYSALVCAGSLDFSDALQLVRTRGELMQSAVPEGTGKMAAILGLEDQQVIAACESAANGEVVSAVNFNSPGQVVIAGETAAVERAIEACKEAGAKRALPLPVSVPSHCALMKGAAEQLAEKLQAVTVNTPVIPVINNVDVAIESDPDAIRDALVRQLYNPVRWTESMQKLLGSDCDSLLECGPGAVLAGLMKRIDRSFATGSLAAADKFDAALEAHG